MLGFSVGTSSAVNLLIPTGAIAMIIALGVLAVALIVVAVCMMAKKRRVPPAPEAGKDVPEETEAPQQAPEEKPAAPQEVPQDVPEETEHPQEVPQQAPEEKPETVRETEGEHASGIVLDDAQAEEGDTVRVYDERKHRFIFVRLNRSYTARLIQAEDETKTYYEQIKNYLLSFEGVKSRTSWKAENFRKGRVSLVRMKMRGKKLCVYFALDPAPYEETKYKVEDVSDVSANDGFPCMYRIKNARRAKYACDLVDAVMEANGIARGAESDVRFAQAYPYETTQELIDRDLIRYFEMTKEVAAAEAAPAPAQPAEHRPIEVREEVKAAEAHDLIEDTEAETLIEESVRVADRHKTGIINIDTLSDYFDRGERVTLEEIKKRVPFFNKKVTYVKVLARGTLNKPLTVEADDFSLDAVKMLALTGGHAVRTRRE